MIQGITFLCHGIHSQPGECDDRSGTWGDNEPDTAVWLFASVSFADCFYKVNGRVYMPCFVP